MKMWIKGIVVGAAALASWHVQAADLSLSKAPVYKAPPASTWNWSGVYIEGFADYGGNFGNAFATSGAASVDLAQIPHGPGIGGALEALYQATGSSWVLGVRAEIGYTNFSATGNMTAGGVDILSLTNATNYLGAFNAELGYTLEPNLLAYLTGGLAFGGAKPNLAAAGICLGGGGCAQAASDTSVGFDVGAGLRYAIPQTPISIFIEGDYSQLGDKSLSVTTANGALITGTTKYNMFVQKLGFTYGLGK